MYERVMSVKIFTIYSSRERVSESERETQKAERVSEREREREFFRGRGRRPKNFRERDERTERFSFFPTASLSLRDKLSSKINFLSQIIYKMYEHIT